jgi:hypothetical protein
VSRVLVTFDEHGEIVDYKLRARDERLWRAIMLAPTIEVCRALLRGESVPLSQLDPKWVERLGRRPR